MALKRPCSQDPDYDEIPAKVQEKRLRIIQKDKRNETRQKIESILQSHFQQELLAKDKEIEKIDDLLHEARCALDRCRACLVAKYYYVTEYSEKDNDTDSAVAESSSHLQTHQGLDTDFAEAPADIALENSLPVVDYPLLVSELPPSSQNEPQTSLSQSAKVKTDLEIVIGNVSKFIPISQRPSDSEELTHIWKLYIREGKGSPKLCNFVEKICVYLHPSFRPNDVIEITKPPYEVTKRGWGDFPLRVKLFFRDTRNKPVDLIHYLKLDKTYTGLTTLGPETHAEITMVTSGEFSQQLNAEVKKAPEYKDYLCFENGAMTNNSAFTEDHSHLPHVVQDKLNSCEKDSKEPNIVPCNKEQKVLLNSHASGQDSLNDINKYLSLFNGAKRVKHFKGADGKEVTIILPPAKLASTASGESVHSVNLASADSSVKSFQKRQNQKVPLYVVKQLASPVKGMVVPKPCETIQSPSIKDTKIGLNGLVAYRKEKCLQKGKQVRNISIKSCKDMKSLLKKIVKHFYTMSKEETERLMSSNVAKQRYAEWHRSGLIRAVLRTARDVLRSRNYNIEFEDWSRKKIILWCRHHGYAPFYRGIINPESVGSEQPVTHTFVDTLSEPAELLAKITDSPAIDEVLDVEAVERNAKDENSLNGHQNLPGPSLPLLQVPYSSPAALFVKETFSQIIPSPLKPSELEPGIFVPAVEEILLAACKSFAEDLVRSSIANAHRKVGKNVSVQQISLVDVYDAVREEPSFEFLTNKYLGVCRKQDTGS